jgi:hypothetical protein
MLSQIGPRAVNVAASIGDGIAIASAASALTAIAFSPKFPVVMLATSSPLLS